MTESTHMLSQRESYAPTKWQEFLWWLSTVEKELIKDCVIDRNRYAIVGMSVLGTWLFATLAWTYFFSTTISNIYASIALGIFMGLIILSIDRMLIKGINSINKNKITSLAFRFVLAITIGFFMAQPALLYLFDKEVHLQISLDNEQRKKDKLEQQEAAIATVKNDLLSKRIFYNTNPILCIKKFSQQEIILLQKQMEQVAVKKLV
jgi:phosphate/sulfate permease